MFHVALPLELHYKGTLLSVTKELYENSGVICLIESANRLSISIPVINDSDSPKRLRANSRIAKLIPLSTDDDLFPLDIDDLMSRDDAVDSNYTLKCNAVKKKNPKPTFSRPICPENEGDSDEVIVRNCAEKYASHLSPVRKQQLVELILIYVEAFSIRGELGRTKSFKYKLKIKQGARFMHEQPFRLSTCERNLMRAEIEKMLKLGVIERCDRYVLLYLLRFYWLKRINQQGFWWIYDRWIGIWNQIISVFQTLTICCAVLAKQILKCFVVLT